MQTKFSVSTFWDKRQMNPKTKEGRIMLWVNLNRKEFCLSLRIRCTNDDYLKAVGGRMLSEKQKVLRNDIATLVLKAETLLSRLNEPTKESFTKFFKSDVNLSDSTKVDAYVLFQLKYDVLITEERFGTASCLKTSKQSFMKYRKELYLEDITESFIKGYQDYMLKKGTSSTSIGIYLRDLRAIYNQAIKDGLISGSKQPFKNIVLASSAKSKAVLYPAQLKQLWNYHSESKRATRAVAFFFFSYLCNGMNFKDIALLKFKNINGDVLSFEREKTKRTKKRSMEIRVYVSEPIKQIIEVWGNPDRSPDNYIFPFMNKYRDAKHFEDTIIRYKRTCNKALVKIGQELKIDVHLCLGLARHSFATKHKLDGTPIAFISEFLGHTSMQTTQHYIKSLPDSNLKLMNQNLLAF